MIKWVFCCHLYFGRNIIFPEWRIQEIFFLSDPAAKPLFIPSPFRVFVEYFFSLFDQFKFFVLIFHQGSHFYKNTKKNKEYMNE